MCYVWVGDNLCVWVWVWVWVWVCVCVCVCVRVRVHTQGIGRASWGTAHAVTAMALCHPWRHGMGWGAEAKIQAQNTILLVICTASLLGGWVAGWLVGLCVLPLAPPSFASAALE